MNTNVDLNILELNFLEFLTNFLEKRTTLSLVFQLNERIYSRNPNSLSPSLITATKKLHDLKKLVDRKEVDEETIMNTVSDIVLEFIDFEERLNI